MGVYSTTVVSDVTGIGTSYDKAKNHLHNLNAGHPERVSGQRFRGRLGTVFLQVTSIVSATKLTLKVTRDSNGDQAVVPSVTATIDPGITTANSGCIVVDIDVPFSDPGNTDSMYLMLKTDAGSVTLSQSCFSWSDD